METTRINSLNLWYRNSWFLLELLSNYSLSYGFWRPRFSLTCSGESRFARHPCLLPEIYILAAVTVLFSPSRKAIAVTCAVEIEQFERAASRWCHRKNITRDWERIFFFFNHRSIRVDYDGKNVLDFFNKFYLLFSQINIFGFVLTCSFFYWIIKLFFIERLDRCIHVMCTKFI